MNGLSLDVSQNNPLANQNTAHRLSVNEMCMRGFSHMEYDLLLKYFKLRDIEIMIQKYKCFSSFEAGDCVSNSSFK